MTSETDLAYLAGVIDSDGSISVRKYARSGRQAVYYPRVKIKQVDSEAVDLAKKHFGGCLYHSKSQAANGKDLVAWEVTNRKAEAFLIAILPYLRIKKDRAVNAIQCAKVTRESIAHKKWKQPRPEAYTEEMEKCYVMSRQLNAVGKEVRRR